MRRAAIACAVASLMWATALPARAYVPESTPARTLAQDTARATAFPSARGALIGIEVMRGGVPLYERNGSTPLVPASLLKLLTTTTAMVKFGPGARFSTTVMATSRAASVRTLYLVGGGDPTFSTDAYYRYRFLPKPTDVIKVPAFESPVPTVEQLARAVASSGVRSVGTIVCDASLFDGARTQRGWRPEYTGTDPEVGFLSALTINEGNADLKGTHLLTEPALAAGQALRAALEADGVSVGGSVAMGRAPARAIQIARVSSPPLSQLIGFTNRYSINYAAELLLKNIGAHFGGGGTTARGVAVVRATMASLGVPLDGAAQYDGSGLSLDDRIEPHTFAVLLDKILTSRGAVWDAMRASLPVAGGPGTLEKRMKEAPVGGNLRGKTGLVNHVRNMAGWVTAADGIPLVYVAMFNGVAAPLALNAPLDLFGLLLARFP